MSGRQLEATAGREDTARQRTVRVKRVARVAGLLGSVERVMSTEHYVRTPTMSTGRLVVTTHVHLAIYAGKPTAKAGDIADALEAEGFTVQRWNGHLSVTS